MPLSVRAARVGVTIGHGHDVTNGLVSATGHTAHSLAHLGQLGPLRKLVFLVPGVDNVG